MKGWPVLFEYDVYEIRLVSEDEVVGGLYVLGKGEDRDVVGGVRMNAVAVVEGWTNWLRGMHAIRKPLLSLRRARLPRVLAVSNERPALNV